MEFYSKFAADKAYAENPDDREVYEAMCRYYQRAFPGEVEGFDSRLDKLFNDAQMPKTRE